MTIPSNTSASAGTGAPALSPRPADSLDQLVATLAETEGDLRCAFDFSEMVHADAGPAMAALGGLMRLVFAAFIERNDRLQYLAREAQANLPH